MKRVLTALALGVLAAGASHAGPQPQGRLSIGEAHPQPRPEIKWRLVRDADFDPYPIHHSGIVARTDVAPNLSVGVGLLNARPKKPGSGEWKQHNGAPPARKGTVSLLLRF